MAVAPFAGPFMLIDHAGDSSGAGLDLGAVAGYDPIRALRVYMPVRLRFFGNGVAVSARIGLRPWAVVIPVGVDISYGVTAVMRYDLSTTALQGTLQIMIGGGL